MAKPGQSSFRRILLSRILLLSVPVLLMGVYVTYRKARSSLLETARQNLTESAVRKGESISESIDALSNNLVTAAESVVLQSGSPAAYQKLLEQLSTQLPTEIQCVQLMNLQTRDVAASTCGNQPLTTSPAAQWLQQRSERVLNRSNLQVTALLPEAPSEESSDRSRQAFSKSQLRLIFSTPVYDQTGNLRFALSVQSAMLQEERLKPGSLSGYPVIIDQDGTILVDPIANRVGTKIQQAADGERLQSLMKNAIAGENSYLHLFSFEKNGVELLAGYTAISSPITDQQDHKWIILAVTRLDSALTGLREIQQVLFILMFGLIVASLLATMYVSRDLALPLEKLTDYALSEQHRYSTDQVPQNFKIREFNHLSKALNSMVERLKAWAEELETAWKEAQAANQLKNEFLANTSHELRTPLNAIIGCIRLVRDDCCDDREEEIDFLQRADDAAIHLLGIINDVLDIAKIEAGKLSVALEPLDLQKLLKEVIDLQVVQIHQKGLQLKTPDFLDPIPVSADPAKLKQVILNVIGNATKFTDSGGITITTHIETGYPLPADGKNGKEPENLDSNSMFPSPITPPGSSLFRPRVVMTVQDTGIGIDPDQQHKLFRPFVMIDGTTTRKFGGTGLGLAISRNLMELMGGSITLFSNGIYQGTTVEIILPIIDGSLLTSQESTSTAKPLKN